MMTFEQAGSALALGLALLLFGMWLLRDGLRELAGQRLQRWLTRVTRSPLRGALAGAAVTAAVQSSSATIVTAIGFASAGLLEFSQALGIVFGANVGTTLTGWLVLGLGIRWKLAFAAPLLALGGVWLHLYARERAASAGRAVAGLAFALLGIEALGDALGGGTIAEALRLVPGDTLGSRAALVALGAGVTLLTQSSSAGVAATLAALHGGALDLPQAAAVVIGFDLGTTGGAVLAALRGSLAARRTGFAHVIFNVFTAIGAFALLPALAAAQRAASLSPEIALVGFHSFFNLVGAAIAIPFAQPFARLVERLVPEHRRTLTRRLDARLLAESGAALSAVAATLGEIALGAFQRLEGMLAGQPPDAAGLEQLETALIETQQFAARVRPDAAHEGSGPSLVASLHAVDELRRLLDRMRQARRIEPFAEDAELAQRARALAAALPRPLGGREHAERALERAAATLAAERSGFRERVLSAAGRGELTPTAALDRLDSWRWLERCAHHGWRIVHHVGRVEAAPPAEREPAEPT
jgi:phosphate:Na+ symporter